MHAVKGPTNGIGGPGHGDANDIRVQGPVEVDHSCSASVVVATEQFLHSEMNLPKLREVFVFVGTAGESTQGTKFQVSAIVASRHCGTCCLLARTKRPILTVG